MPEFLGVRCFVCGTFQTIQQTKVSKFDCKVCPEGKKQSVKQIYASSYQAKDIRQVIQQLNMSRSIREHDRFETLHHPIQHMQQEQEQEQVSRPIVPRAGISQWAKFEQKNLDDASVPERDFGAEPDPDPDPAAWYATCDDIPPACSRGCGRRRERGYKRSWDERRATAGTGPGRGRGHGTPYSSSPSSSSSPSPLPSSSSKRVRSSSSPSSSPSSYSAHSASALQPPQPHAYQPSTSTMTISHDQTSSHGHAHAHAHARAPISKQVTSHISAPPSRVVSSSPSSSPNPSGSAFSTRTPISIFASTTTSRASKWSPFVSESKPEPESESDGCDEPDQYDHEAGLEVGLAVVVGVGGKPTIKNQDNFF